jgi:hypothetical protein
MIGKYSKKLIADLELLMFVTNKYKCYGIEEMLCNTTH